MAVHEQNNELSLGQQDAHVSPGAIAKEYTHDLVDSGVVQENSFVGSAASGGASTLVNVSENAVSNVSHIISDSDSSSNSDMSEDANDSLNRIRTDAQGTAKTVKDRMVNAARQQSKQSTVQSVNEGNQAAATTKGSLISTERVSSVSVSTGKTAALNQTAKETAKATKTAEIAAQKSVAAAQQAAIAVQATAAKTAETTARVSTETAADTSTFGITFIIRLVAILVVIIFATLFIVWLAVTMASTTNKAKVENVGLPEAVEAWRGEVTSCCLDIGLDTDWVPWILAMMAQESGGDINCSQFHGAQQDIMQAEEGHFGSIIRDGLAAHQGTTRFPDQWIKSDSFPSSDIQANTAKASIYAGCLTFQQSLLLAESLTGQTIEPSNIAAVSSVVQGYNFSTEWNGWVYEHYNFVYTYEHAYEFAEYMVTKTGVISSIPPGYGNPRHAEKVASYITVVEGDEDSEYSGSIAYVQAGIDFAADDTIGYSQANRNHNPDMDCSSFVSYSLQAAGYDCPVFSTANEPTVLKNLGFAEYQFTGVGNLQEGDILWVLGHTEIYIGNGKTVGAHSNYDRIDGDSSGREVCIDNCSSSWTKYYRLTA